MKITIENTSKVIWLGAVQYRVWEGHTDEGIPCYAFIPRIEPNTPNERQRIYFSNQLLNMKHPSPFVASLPEHLDI